ncbi:hypothetical protein ACP46_gp59 [Rhizobium phage RHEph06]|uniref:Uncharacterized protein n=2 Tax=Kleczkowskavirus RHEph4 TaxID=1921526 RepID=L7TN29_9CAUD|nr:hypothetical protein ACP46_gp59 [Rhizobium phage RHEph06]YP_009598500.1 hypothetical protein FDH25_gp58 [Rhizobium phage RHEph04]AGC35820.1 hypothetical protein RHEph05_gp053 [Rhizobium phage RHEph05]QXV74937.1 hypothetical protein [Rhizobium phage RHEph26]AGC35744.1 hypothetical protein RHEph04_gp058 [Rhizobium phage RHEph04]AGC35901.1 hypothetical protein RHEph06_gp059 [Rhizobium phage RHEph06]
MPNVYFTQYLRPDGRKQIISIDRPAHVVAKADHILSHGFRFECEELTTGEVSLTISDDWGDYAFELCANGPAVPASVDKLILEFDVARALTARAINKK